MERVRGGKTQHVAVPAAATHALAPVLLSKDERQQLRVVKHRAFQRHQQNAMWTRSVFEFDGVTHRLSSGGDSESAEFVRDADYDAPHGEREGGEREGAGVMTQTRHTEEESRLREQIDAKAREIESTKLLIAQFEHDQQRNQERFEELMSGLRSIADSAALATFEGRVQQERVYMLPTPVRELEIVKL